MLPVTAATIQTIVAQLPDLQLVYLFGSWASGNTGPTSDYDFALLVSAAQHGPAARAAFSHALTTQLIDAGFAPNRSSPSPVDSGLVDVVLLNRAPIELAHSVIATGRLLYRNSLATQVEYEAYVLARYGDWLPVLRFFRHAARQESSGVTNNQRYRTALERTERTLAQIRATDRTG